MIKNIAVQMAFPFNRLAVGLLLLRVLQLLLLLLLQMFHTVAAQVGLQHALPGFQQCCCLAAVAALPLVLCLL